MVLVRTGCLFALAAVVALAGACSKRPGATGTDARFRGQILRIVVGRSPGGTYNLYTRAMAESFGRHVPGHPTVVVENMPGAGRPPGAEISRPRGATRRPDDRPGWSAWNPGASHRRSRDTSRRGTVSRARLAGRRRAGLRVFARKPDRLAAWRTNHVRPRLGVTSYGTSSQINTALMLAALQLPAQIIVGYKGTAEIRQGLPVASSMARASGSMPTWPLSSRRTTTSSRCNLAAARRRTLPVCRRSPRSSLILAGKSWLMSAG